MLQNSNQMFQNAIKGNYAIGAFNFVNYETLKAILNTAQKLNSPVIIQSSVGAIKYMDIKVLKAMVHTMCENLTIPVCWNLDHGKTFEDCKQAIDYGFTSVMIDASDKPFLENIEITKKVVEYAHRHGVSVEAELGTLKGVEDEIDVKEDEAFYTNPQQVVEFVKQTNVDSLAIAIGTSHGAYKFKGEAKLQFSILEEIEKLLPNFPLVLHGASSIPEHLVEKANKFGANIQNAKGVTEALLQKACTRNICKINVDSDLRIAFLAGIRENLTLNPQNIDIRAYLSQGTKEIESVIEHKIANVLNSKNKA